MHIRIENGELIAEIFETYPDMSLVSIKVVEVTNTNGEFLFTSFLPIEMDYDEFTQKYTKYKDHPIWSLVTGPAGDGGNYYRVKVQTLYEGVIQSEHDIPLVNETI